MTNELTIELLKNNEIEITKNGQNIIENIADAFQKAVNKGTEKLNLEPNTIEKIKSSLGKFDIKSAASSAAESALKTGMKKMGMKVSTFNSIKSVIEAVKEGDLKKGLSSVLSIGISTIKVPSTVKTFLTSSKNLILEKAFEDELKTVMKKQQNTISRIDKKCNELEKALIENDEKTIEKLTKTLTQDLNKVMPIAEVLKRANEVMNKCILMQNKKQELTKEELELCQKLA